MENRRRLAIESEGGDDDPENGELPILLPGSSSELPTRPQGGSQPFLDGVSILRTTEGSKFSAGINAASRPQLPLSI